MSGTGRYKLNNDDLVQQIINLEERISRLERTPHGNGLGVNSGGIVITDGGYFMAVRTQAELDNADVTRGEILISPNGYDVNGEDGINFIYFRAKDVRGANTLPDGTTIDGNPIYQMVSVEGPDDSFRNSTLFLYDKSGDPVITDTQFARRGLGHPYIQTPWYDPDGGKTTTSATFVRAYQAEWYQYHPHIRFRFVANNGAGTTGEYRVVDIFSAGSPVVGGPIQSGPGSAFVDIVVKRRSLASGETPNGNPTILELQHRRVSGANNVNTIMASLVGIDLSFLGPDSY